MGQSRRALAALLLIVGAVVLAIAVDGVLDAVGAASKVDRALAAADAQSQARYAFDGASGVGGDGEVAPIADERTGTAALPSWFEDELLSLDSARSVRVSREGGVVGFSRACSADDAFAQVKASLSSKGWFESKTGVERCSVFVKEGGVCRWAMVSCVPVGTGASVVVQCATSEW